MLVEHPGKHSAVHLSWQVFGGLLQDRVKLYSPLHLLQLAQPPDLASPVSVLQYSKYIHSHIRCTRKHHMAWGGAGQV